MSRTAKCCCGACTIEAEGEPTFSGVCHCDNCRRRTGSALGWSVYFTNEQLSAPAGPLQLYEFASAAAGELRQRFFCRECGTTLYWTSPTMPTMTGIAGGCFAEALPPPSITQLDSQRVAWLTLPQDLQHWG